MKIAIDLTSLSDNFSGLERMALELTKALVNTASAATKDPETGESSTVYADTQFILVIKNELPEVLKPLSKRENIRFVRIKGRNKLLANQITLPLTMRRIEADAYIFPAFPVPILFKKPGTYGMIADLGCYDVPQTMKKKQVVFFRECNKHTAKVSKKVLTISEFSSGRIQEILKTPAEKILDLYVGINHPAPESYTKERIAQVKVKYKLPDKYLLSLSTIEPRKNLRLLIQAYMEINSRRADKVEEVFFDEEAEDVTAVSGAAVQEANADPVVSGAQEADAEIGSKELAAPLPPLVLAGRRGWLMEDDIAMAVESGRIIFTGFVDDDDLPGLYAGAEAFVFPSLYEGFGMPPLEAQAAGVRKVLSSDAPALKEVLGDTAMYFKNNDKQSLKNALSRLNDYEGAESAAIAANLDRFTWEKSAAALWEELTL